MVYLHCGKGFISGYWEMTEFESDWMKWIVLKWILVNWLIVWDFQKYYFVICENGMFCTRIGNRLVFKLVFLICNESLLTQLLLKTVFSSRTCFLYWTLSCLELVSRLKTFLFRLGQLLEIVFDVKSIWFVSCLVWIFDQMLCIELRKYLIMNCYLIMTG